MLAGFAAPSPAVVLLSSPCRLPGLLEFQSAVHGCNVPYHTKYYHPSIPHTIWHYYLVYDSPPPSHTSFSFSSSSNSSSSASANADASSLLSSHPLTPARLHVCHFPSLCVGRLGCWLVCPFPALFPSLLFSSTKHTQRTSSHHSLSLPHTHIHAQHPPLPSHSSPLLFFFFFSPCIPQFAIIPPLQPARGLPAVVIAFLAAF
ncbi:hypothetical protein B0J11DRAFT_110008 [Dendryphion nanum]|uniref:Uncharacterized protein n=1 Tax=Dendryphion nanum TaxID=256645 RepID=A0A9P9DDW6_9PLEO|nr:hypothetical protein B0J11DRAFT_110008 [Dendryphion nanum]